MRSLMRRTQSETLALRCEPWIGLPAIDPKVTGSNLVPATNSINGLLLGRPFLFESGVAPG
jgi:hypothetical protein